MIILTKIQIMRNKKLLHVIVGIVFIGLLCISCSHQTNKDEQKDEKLNVLIFSKVGAYRHESIEPGGAALKSYFAAHSISSTQTEDSTIFTANQLSSFDVVMFFQTTGIILDSLQRDAFAKFIRSGKGFVGIHSAADTEYDWPWFVNLVGVQFADHPDIQQATFVKVDTQQLTVKHLPARWTRMDECYNYKQLPANVNVVLTVDESTYQGGTHGSNHPISWYHTYDGGRSFYTAMGHTVENYQDTLFLEHILQGVKWAGGHFD